MGDWVQLGGRKINRKLTISFLLPAVFMLLLVACGDSQPLPDIEATVEARVEVAKASMVAPAVALPPIYTPLPTYTPAPVPAPEVVVKEVPVEKIVEVVVTASPIRRTGIPNSMSGGRS